MFWLYIHVCHVSFDSFLFSYIYRYRTIVKASSVMYLHLNKTTRRLCYGGIFTSCYQVCKIGWCKSKIFFTYSIGAYYLFKSHTHTHILRWRKSHLWLAEAILYSLSMNCEGTRIFSPVYILSISNSTLSPAWPWKLWNELWINSNFIKMMGFFFLFQKVLWDLSI